MAQKSLTELMDERLAAIEGVVESLAEKGGDTELNDLRVLLLEIVSLLGRDPGVEICVDDLYGAGVALVRERLAGTFPLARQLRLLRDARCRFHDRLLAAAARVGPDEYKELERAASAYASRRANMPMVDLSWYRRMSA